MSPITPAVDWQRHGVFYQVYPRSFADADGDGVGDIAGIRSQLEHIASLGVDGLWINPWYASPLRDGGYDVADHMAIDPTLGSLDDARGLFADADRLGLRVLVDLVPNHTSDIHPWFVDALRSEPGSPARRRYHFRRGRGCHGELPPSNWVSAFGGPAWTAVGDGEWYLHLFDSSQPDLDWRDPTLVAEFEAIIRFWIDAGASGFRVDAVQGICKDPKYPDWTETGEAHLVDGHDVHPYRDRSGTHEIVRGWRRVLDSYPDRSLALIGEVVVRPWDRLAAYLEPDEFDQVFNFDFLESRWDADELRRRIDSAMRAAAAHGALPTWVWSNHDIVRVATRFGLPVDVDPTRWLLGGDRGLLDPIRGLARARAAAMLAMALPGAYFLYQGEELGLPEVHDLPLECVSDPIYQRSGRAIKGRDGCRVPIPWTRGGPSLGFGPVPGWLPQPAGWGEWSVEAQRDDPSSTLELFRACLRVRSERFLHDRFAWCDVPGAIAFRRGDVMSITNFGPCGSALPAGEVLASSAPCQDGVLPPDTTAWVRTSTTPGP